MVKNRPLLALLFSLLLLPVKPAAQDRVTVFAAASLQGTLEEVAQAHGGDLTVSFGGSGQMARQIAQGAPADLILLANAQWMFWLEREGLLSSGSVLNLLGNDIVLIAPEGASEMPEITAGQMLRALDGGRLAMGQSQSVPAGIYARQWLENTGLWTALAPHLAEVENVRAALALVARGEAPLGVVYATDARAEPAVTVVHRIPPQAHDPILYPMAVVRGRNRPEVAGFAAFLTSDRAAEIFRAHGFVPLPERVR